MAISVSVIVITKNNIRTIEKCLHSLLDQNYPKKNIEIIFVDGGSSDGTDKLIKKYSKTFPFIKLYYEEIGTMGYARNIGIFNSKGEIIAFTDADAFPEKEWIKKIVKAFRDDAKIAIVGGLDILSGGDKIRNTMDSWRRLEKSFNIKAIPKIKTVNFAMKRDAALACGGFDPTLNHFDEGELMARLYFGIKTAKIVYDPNIIVYHERHPLGSGLGIRKMFQKSFIGVPVLLRKHLFKVAMSNIVSPLGTSLCFVFACGVAPFLLLALLYSPHQFVVVLSVILALGLSTIVFYTVSVKRVTGKLVLGIPLLLTLDILVRFAGTFVGLTKWLINSLITKFKGK